MDEDLANFLLESATVLSTIDFSSIGQLFGKKTKCSQCGSTLNKSTASNFLKTSCCQILLCKECTSKHLKQEGWFSRKTSFACPSCSKKTLVS
jgi:hypothetical protein